MFVWEWVAHQLRAEGWDLAHRGERAGSLQRYTVVGHRSGVTWRVDGETLTEAFAAAARRAREVSRSTMRKADEVSSSA